MFALPRNIRLYKASIFTIFSKRNLYISDESRENIVRSIKSSSNWDSVKNEIITSNDRVTPNIVNYTILSTCLSHGLTEEGIDFANYLQENKHPLNMAIMSKLLMLYGSLNLSQPSKEYEDKILQLYETLKSKYKLLDASLNESLIIGLATTSQFKLCFDILDEIKLTSSPSIRTCSSLIIACFNNNMLDDGFKLMQDLFNSNKSPLNECYFHFIQKHADKIEKMFQMWSDNDIIIHQEVAEYLQKECKGKVTQIFTNQCKLCKQHLPGVSISNEEFNILKTEFLQKVIVGQDSFRKTTPEELKKFLDFLAAGNKYDVILDGLNIAYSKGVRDFQRQGNNLLAVINHFQAQNKSILVIGRIHMKKWPQFREMKNKATLFLAQNLSQDDPYLLYCALNSGKGTVIVSRDFMRSHTYLLKDVKLKQIFKRWLTLSQHQLVTVTAAGKAILRAPPSFLLSTQNIGNTWHIPFSLSPKSLNSNETNKEFDIKWICVQTK